MIPNSPTATPTPVSDSEIDLGQRPAKPDLLPDDPGKLPLTDDVFDPVARRDGRTLPGVDLPVPPIPDR